MPMYKVGNMWDETANRHFVTTNAMLTHHKPPALVMGAGAALDAKKLFPRLPIEMAEKMLKLDTIMYGCLVSDQYPVGIFQTKDHWKDYSKISLIKYSVQKMIELIEEEKPSKYILNFPGIGMGGLKESEVLPHLEKLPDCVVIYRRI